MIIISVCKKSRVSNVQEIHPKISSEVFILLFSWDFFDELAPT